MPNLNFFGYFYSRKPSVYNTSGSSSVGRASASQAEGRGFESRFPLFYKVAPVATFIFPRRRNQKIRRQRHIFFLFKKKHHIDVVLHIRHVYSCNSTFSAMEDPLHNYRIPSVTVTGIFLGFIFNATASWASRPPTGSRFNESVITIALCSCIILLIIVLYRLLNIDYPRDKAVQYFRRTLHLFIAGLVVVFLGFVLIKTGTVFTYITR
jgi:hypothetical protein